MRRMCIRVVIVLAAALATGCNSSEERHGPMADCAVVGKVAASFELGNYAPVEERAPTEARFVEACRKAGVDQKQGECLLAAKDVWSAAACAPKLFPEVNVSGDCGAIASRVREAVKGFISDQKQIDKMTMAIHTSCDQDGWPAPFKACVLDAKDVMTDMDKCEKLMTPELKAKLEARMRSMQ